MRFCEASAKDNFNVDEIFLKLVDDILKKVLANSFLVNRTMDCYKECFMNVIVCYGIACCVAYFYRFSYR